MMEIISSPANERERINERIDGAKRAIKKYRIKTVAAWTAIYLLGSIAAIGACVATIAACALDTEVFFAEVCMAFGGGFIAAIICGTAAWWLYEHLPALPKGVYRKGREVYARIRIPATTQKPAQIVLVFG